MLNFDRPWFIAGGWAVDLFMGDVTREHKDIEIAILRRDQLALQRYLRGWELGKVIPASGEGTFIWQEGEWLELPIHEIRARRINPHLSELEVVFNESSEDEWRFRRNLLVRRPLSMVGQWTKDGIPFLSPEIVLLYKAKNPDSHDRADFENVLDILDEEQRRWLRQSIAVCHPGRTWLKHL